MVLEIERCPSLSPNSKCFTYDRNENSFHGQEEIVNLMNNGASIHYDGPYLILLIFVDFGLWQGYTRLTSMVISIM